MTTTRAQPTALETTPPAAEGPTIVCGFNASRGSRVAYARAAELAERSGAHLRLVAVASVRGDASIRETQLDPGRVRTELGRLRRSVRRRGVVCSTHVAEGGDAVAGLLGEARGAELLVIGAPVTSRAGGIVLGTTATRLLHEATVPLLVARRSDAGRALLDTILVASDGSERSTAAVEAAARLAGRDSGRPVRLVHAGPEDRVVRRRLGEHAALLEAWTGVEPVIMVRSGDPPEAIVDAALAAEATLVVVGARGLHGIRALGSVSERVAHVAPCSVLVVRS